MIPKNHSAFTLVEILIAIGIVAIFIAVPVVAYSSYSQTQRDIKRKSDVDQIQQALTQYKATTGKYPDEATWDTDLINSGYLTDLPSDPKDGQDIDGTNLSYGYSYTSDGNSYVLSALLEKKDASAGEDEVSFYTASAGGTGIYNAIPGETGSGNPVPTGAPRAQNTGIPTSTPYLSKTPTNTRTPTPTATPTPEFDTTSYTAASGLITLIRGGDNNMWFTTDMSSQPLGKLTSDGTLTHYSLPLLCTNPNDIASSATRIWVSSSSNSICATDFSGNVANQFTLDTTDNRSITVGGDNNIWIASHTTNTIYKMNATTGVSTPYTVNRPRKVEPGGSYVWYANFQDTDTGVGRLATSNGAVTHLDSYAGEPNDFAVGNGNTSGYVAVNNNYILEFSTDGSAYLLPVPVDSVTSVEIGPDGHLWYSGLSGSTARIGKINTTTREDIDNWDVPILQYYSIENIVVESNSVIWYTSGNRIYKLTFN